MIRGRAAAIGALLAAACLAVAGCGGAGDTASSEEQKASERSAPKAHKKPTEAEPKARVKPSHCPGGRPSCRTTMGRIVYVERVDPDGDGDAHFVIHDPQGITLRGITVIDVRKGLRPHPLPGAGETISAAGPVQIGSYGQEQIHALEVHVAGE
ncbi:MAG TPA: hypothetical protein VJQ84_00155 [Solirubrobacterales bacterium]|nr:hypothetical protein [Solirubrobacterales bacterium]